MPPNNPHPKMRHKPKPPSAYGRRVFQSSHINAKLPLPNHSTKGAAISARPHTPLSLSEFFAPGDRPLRPGQRAELRTIAHDGSNETTVLIADQVIEAPNWTPDGQWLIFNAGGELWRIPADGSAKPEQIDTGSIRRLNNDHVLSPDGQTIYMSNGDGHLYAVPISGGEPRKVSNDHEGFFRYYLHGISPDGQTLSFVAIEGDEPRRINIFTIPSAGGPDTRLSDIDKPNDGPEFSPDGQWIYFNSERAAKTPGHAQIFRMHPDGTNIEQLTTDARVNWFPHPSPDGEWIVFISYPENTLGHPADKSVILRRMRPDGSDQSDITAFFGGQGTINVNSWSPDSQHFAYVAYPMD
ncbi:TolB family protein [Pelagibacterium luteolum]|uniref:WD40-like Beta Propeller Repeat n=1 Tax=Pelagibacterium luteolum TaxID=440168 RepID=A0A1G7UKW8_9HYPH|nr:biopolymer transporter Tol [Pelagibacterium luteolum]SDG47729.1 WD40-like Beta Propeller Repeat [Pelagibacterium luteolum]